MSEVIYNGLDVNKAIEIHEEVFRKTELERGVENLQKVFVDRGKIESILHHITNDDYYPNFIEKLAHIVFSINKSHAFSNGNKRASLAISVFFLELNGHDEFVHQYQQGMEEVVIWIAKSLIDKEHLESIIEFLLYDDPLNVEYFIAQAKHYRIYIEPENAPINKTLLCRMIEEWLSDEMELSESTKVAILEAIDPNGFSYNKKS